MEIARTFLERARGLIGRDHAPSGGMMILRCNCIHTFFMRFPIDATFYDRYDNVIKVVRNIRPWKFFVWGGWRAVKVLETESKFSIRKEMKSRRAAVSPECRAAASHSVCIKLIGHAATADVICVYDALKSELDLAEFIADCRNKGKKILFPEKTVNGGYDVADAESVDLWVCPGLAFTHKGERLGFGGGWYDRFLARKKSGARALGVAYDFQIVDYLPQEPFDILLDGVVVA